MESFETSNGSDRDAPDLFLGESIGSLFVFANLLEQVTIICKVHHNA